MISNDNFAGAFGAGPTDDMAALARNAVRLGFAVVPIEPGGKIPLCTLAARAAKTADLAAQELGERRHRCGINHAITDPLEADKVFKRLSKERPGLNIGVEVGRSTAVGILVDCDNQDSVEAWITLWNEQSGGFPAVTVRTPGRQSPDGTWVHKDGAHFWLEVPEDIDLTGLAVGSMQLPGNISMSWHSRQALVPPSVRHEGAYRLVGKVEMAPEWLLDMILAHAEAQAQVRAAQRLKMAVTDGSDPIDVWSAQAPWSDLLEAAGWTPAGSYDTCGPHCAIWTRPGAANLKSATAHEPECLVTDTSTGWGPLHIWSDDAKADLGSSHLSKLQFVAKTQHAGDTPAAMAALDLGSIEAMATNAELDGSLEELFAAGPPRTRTRSREAETEPSPLGAHVAPQPSQNPQTSPGPAPGVTNDPTAPTTTTGPGYGDQPTTPEVALRGGRVDLLRMLNGTLPPAPTPTILGRSDGNALFYRGTINQLIGESEGGKTWIALAALAEVLNAGGMGAYVDIDGNGDPALISRLTQLGVDVLLAAQEDRVAIFRPSDPDEFRDVVKIISRSTCSLLVVDSFGEAMPIFGLKTNDNDEVTTFMAEQLAPMAAAGAAVLIIDHVTKDKETRNGTGIGAQAKKRRTDGAYIEVVIKDVFSRAHGGAAKLYVRKDRHSGLNDATAADRYWGTFKLIPGAGYGIEAAIAEAPSSAPEAAKEERRELVEHRKVTLSKVLEARLVMDDDMIPVTANRLKEDGVGFDSSKIKGTLEALLAGGYVKTFKAGGLNVWVSTKPYESLEEALDDLG